MDEIVVGAKSANVGIGPDGKPVQLTAAGVPRKKPGRKPGSTVKPKTEAGQEAPKPKRQRKPKDPNAPPVQRKRKTAPNTDADVGTDSKSLASASPAMSAPPAASPPAGPSRQTKITDLVSAMPPEPDTASYPDYPVKAPKREPYVGSMQNILNATDVPVRTGGQNYDPIRGNYDPVRETMISRDPYGTYGTNSVSSPRPHIANRASASPSISVLVDPVTHPSPLSPPQLSRQSSQQHQPSAPPLRAPVEPSSVPPSPSPNPPRTSLPPPLKPPPPAPPAAETRKPVPSAPPATATKPEAPKKETNGVVTISKKPSPKQKPNTAASSPKTNTIEEPPAGNSERSILDFGKAKPGEELQAPTIMLEIKITPGETNKYVNFMRLAEERYGWDALHPRLAAQRDRKARIAAAASALEKNGSGRESGDEMSEDVSDGEGASADHQVGAASGADVPAKPARKKRNFKEDEYDRDDDFVDDSELMWEEHAAASRDGFFVYSGPLVREEDKPVASYVTTPLLPNFKMGSLTLTTGPILPSEAAEAEEAEAAEAVPPEPAARDAAARARAAERPPSERGAARPRWRRTARRPSGRRRPRGRRPRRPTATPTASCRRRRPRRQPPPSSGRGRLCRCRCRCPPGRGVSLVVSAALDGVLLLLSGSLEKAPVWESF